jgi:hypothetical protein
MTMNPVPQPNCPNDIRVTESVAMAHVVDVDCSVEFYSLLGFACDSRFSAENGVTNWSSISSGKARLMLARASAPVDSSQQAVLFYMYSPNVLALRAHLLKAGVADAGLPPCEEGSSNPKTAPTGAAVYQVVPRFYMPAGELRIHDPDGYCILVGQLG